MMRHLPHVPKVRADFAGYEPPQRKQKNWPYGVELCLP